LSAYARLQQTSSPHRGPAHFISLRDSQARCVGHWWSDSNLPQPPPTPGKGKPKIRACPLLASRRIAGRIEVHPGGPARKAFPAAARSVRTAWRSCGWHARRTIPSITSRFGKPDPWFARHLLKNLAPLPHLLPSLDEFLNVSGAGEMAGTDPTSKMGAPIEILNCRSAHHLKALP
jgi:hypothetical protein